MTNLNDTGDVHDLGLVNYLLISKTRFLKDSGERSNCEIDSPGEIYDSQKKVEIQKDFERSFQKWAKRNVYYVKRWFQDMKTRSLF